MKSKILGRNTSEIEVVNIDSHGFWLFINEKEYFLPYSDFPWFKDVKIKDIINVELLHDSHIHWPSLDVDLNISILEDLINYPLIYR